MRKLFFRLTLIAAMAIGVSAAWANGTPAGNQIINTVVARFSNIGSIWKTNLSLRTNTVGTNFGISSTQFTQQQFVSPGASVAYLFGITNKGNYPEVIRLTNTFWKTNGGYQLNGFTVGIYTNAAKIGGLIPYFSLNEEAFQKFYLVVTVPAAALDQGMITNRFGSFLTNTFSARFSSLGRYLGLNGLTNYAGVYGLTNKSITIVQAPSLNVLKTSSVTNSAAYQLLATVAYRDRVVPGSEIIFSVIWTNAGSGVLQHFSFNDQIQPSYAWVTNSVYFTNGARYQASHHNYLMISNGGLGRKMIDNGVQNLASSNYGIQSVYNAGTQLLTVSYFSNIPSHAKGSVFYKVTVK